MVELKLKENGKALRGLVPIYGERNNGNFFFSFIDMDVEFNFENTGSSSCIAS